MFETFYELYVQGSWVTDYLKRKEAIAEANRFRREGCRVLVYRWWWVKKSHQWEARREAF